MQIVLIDNYDSFTYNLAQYFWEMNFPTIVCRNDQITVKQIEELKTTHIVISPGPGTPDDSGISMSVIEYFKGKLPILGVCLGHQCIGKYFGGSVVRIDIPKHGKTSQILHEGAGVFKEIPSPFVATRYHSLVVAHENFPSTLEVTATSADDGFVMGLRHKTYKIYGVQFHPESIMTEHGHQMLRNFINA